MLPFLESAFHKRGSLGILCLQGHLTRATWEQAQSLLCIGRKKVSQLGLDCTYLQALDSKGLYFLSILFASFTKQEIPITLWGLQPELYDILDLVDLDSPITLADSEEQFLQNSSQHPTSLFH